MTSIAFTGDIAFTNYFKNSWKNPDFISNNIYSFLHQTDYTVANLEGPMTDKAIQSNRKLNHSTTSKALNCIEKMNANIWNLANNHIMDCGEEGCYETLKLAKKNNCTTLGVGKNIYEAEKSVIIDKDGGIGIFSVTYTKDCVMSDENKAGCVVWDDFDRIEKSINDIKRLNRWCILIVHGGEEFSNMPMPHVRKRYMKYLDMGADIIVSHHPHVVQNYEIIGGKTIFYSLGNFVFDTDFQRGRRYTDKGILVKINFNSERYYWEYLPIKINRINNTINECECPPIFRNITNVNYNLLWPLAAKDYLVNNRKKMVFLEPRLFEKYGWIEWFKHDLRNCRFEWGRYLLVGFFVSYLNLWRFSSKNIYRYLK